LGAKIVFGAGISIRQFAMGRNIDLTFADSVPSIQRVVYIECQVWYQRKGFTGTF